MKHVKKLLAVVLSAALAMAMCVTAFAADPTVSVKDESGNTYVAYKILDGTLAGTNAYTYDTTTAFAALKSENGLSGYKFDPTTGKITTLAGVEVVQSAHDQNTAAYKNDQIADFAAKMAKVASTTDGITLPHTLAPGYYVVVETASKDSQTDTHDEKTREIQKEVASKPMLIDVRDEKIEIDPKADEVDLTKVILNGESEKKNNVNIGDHVQYKITTEFPNYEAGLDEDVSLKAGSIVFTLTDTFGAGLTYDENNNTYPTVVNVGTDTNVAKSAGATKTYNPTYDGTTRKLTIDFDQDYILAHQGETITVTYYAQLNENAVINGSNPNDIQLDYTNNPNEDNTHKTLKDHVDTYTYGFKLRKVDEKEPSKGLEDAHFTVRDADNAYVIFTKSGGKFIVDEEKTKELKERLKDLPFNDSTADKDVKRELGVADNGSFKLEGDDTTYYVEIISKGANTYAEEAEVIGLDAGTYKIHETKAPDKFTILNDDIVVTISDGDGTVDTVLDGKPTMSTTVGGKASKNVDSITDENGTATGSVKPSADNGIQLAVFVADKEGATLPETGARTAMYCMIGGAAVIVLGAGYYLIGARRNKKEQ